MQQTSILKMRAAYWANLQVMMSIDRKERDFWVYHHLQSADTVNYILKDIFISITKEQCSDQGESKWKREKECENNMNDRLLHIKWLHIADTLMA